MVDMLLASLGSVPELEGEWWVLALLGVLTLLLVVAIVFMFISAFNHKEIEDDEEPQYDLEEEEEPEPEDDEDDEDDDDDDDEDDDEDDKDDKDIAPISVASSVEYTTVYNRSFMARLSQSSVEQKVRYNELKNHILSYKKVKSRISWSFDSFNCGRNKLIKLQCKGKNLVMYAALDPNSLDQKYRVKDMSEIQRYQAVPSRIKIKSDRTLKYAKELVDKLMGDNNIVAKTNYDAVDFTVPFMETEELIANGLIKTRETTARPFYN